MITEAQNLEVQNYLIGKKLPLDVAIELQDHFISQIEIFQNSGNIGFTQAFLKTKILWKNELLFRKKSIFSFQKVTQFLYNLHDQQYKKLYKKAIIFSFLFCLLQFSTAFIFNEDYYYAVNALAFLAGIILSIFIFFYLIFSKIDKKRTMVEQYFYTEITSVFIVVCFLSVLNIFGDLSINSFNTIYSFLHQTGTIYFEEFLAAVSSMFINISVLSYVLLLLKTRNSAINKLNKLQTV